MRNLDNVDNSNNSDIGTIVPIPTNPYEVLPFNSDSDIKPPTISTPDNNTQVPPNPPAIESNKITIPVLTPGNNSPSHTYYCRTT